MPTADETKQLFADLFNRASDSYDAVDADFFTPMGARLIEHARLAEGDHVLDLGTGRGAALIPAARAVSTEGSVTGVDLSSGMVEATQRDVDALGLANTSLWVGDAEHPPSRDGGYDAVTTALLVFFLPDGPGSLARWRSLLKPNGTLTISTFAFGDERWEPVFAVFDPYLPEGMKASQLPPAGWHSTDDALHQTLTEAGYRNVSSSTEAFKTRFTDPDHWLRFSRSHGGLFHWDAIPTGQHTDVESQLVEALEPLMDDDGTLTLITGTRFTTARA
jgi:ubiquinone/menaquinone biosynthesis C-methylase UbiE